MAYVRSVLAVVLLTFALASGAHAQSGPPCSFAQALVQSTATEGSHVLVSSIPNPGPPRYLCWLTTTITTASGYLMIFDATAAPTGGGAATPTTLRYCAPITSNGTNGGLALSWPEGQALAFTTGIVVGFSTTGCYTVTYSTTAAFFAGVQ